MLSVTIESREREVYNHPEGRVVATSLGDVIDTLADDQDTLVILERGELTVYPSRIVTRLSGLTKDCLISPDEAEL